MIGHAGWAAPGRRRRQGQSVRTGLDRARLRPAPWVRLRAGHSPTVEALIEFCKTRIAHYKVPKFWKFVTEFPMTVSGKVRKVEMREVSTKELGLKK